MNYKILFFSVNRPQQSYFNSLMRSIKGNDKAVSLHKRSLLFRLPSLFFTKIDISLIHEVNKMRMGYFYNKKGIEKSDSDQLLRRIFYFITTFVFLLKIKKIIVSGHYDLILLWNDMKWHQYLIKKIALEQNVKTIFFENGTLPNTVTFDPIGVNFNNSVPKDQSFYLNRLVKSEVVNGSESKATKIENGYIFVPFQVDYDTQIISHSPWVKNMENFYRILERLVSSLPKTLTFVIKEHPKSARNYDYLHYKNPRIKFYNAEKTDKLVLNSLMVMTINSTVGLESIIKNKPVLVLGNAFYSIKGLCETVKSEQELINKIYNVMEPDEQIKKSFVSYLKEYYVEGDWRAPSLEHIELIEQRIYKELEKK
ncbi:MAG: capsular polysaccharide export protein [Oleispira sp.]|jgi:capsular polysaccharide export protein